MGQLGRVRHDLGLRWVAALTAVAVLLAVVTEQLGWRAFEQAFRGATWADELLVALLVAGVGLLALVVRRTMTLQHAVRQGQRLDEEVRRHEAEGTQRREAFARIAHELANPVTPLRLQLAALRQAASPTQMASVVLAERSAARLSVVVQDLLDLARHETQGLALNLEPTDLAELARQVAGEYACAAEQAGVALRVFAPHPAPAHVDRVRVEQVVANLVGNAIKFTPAGGTVTLHVERAHHAVLVHVADTGRGLTSAQRVGLFAAFHGGSEQGRWTGSGLGLHIARLLVEAHGGTIWAHSDGPGHGTTVSLRIPLSGAGDPSK